MSLWSRHVASACLLLSCAAAAAAGPATAPAGDVVFESAGDDAAVWKKADGGRPLVVPSDPAADHAPYLKLGNSVVRADLPRTLDGDWTLSFRAAHTDFQRGLWVGLFDAAGTKGYAVLWDSSSENAWSGQGSVSVRRFDLESEPLFKSGAGKAVSGSVPSGHKPTGRPFAQFTLRWEKDGGTLVLLIDGAEKLRVSGQEPIAVGRLYLRGNSSALLDDLKVTAPAAAAAAAAAPQASR